MTRTSAWARRARAPRGASRTKTPSGSSPRAAGSTPSSVSRSGERQHRERRRAPGPGRPGKSVQRAARHARYAGATRLRRRLSKILKRLMSGRRLRSKPVRVRHQGQEPAQDLPVAAHPAVLAPRVGEHARRVVVDQLESLDERRARVEALEQVVRQERVLGHAPVERRAERVDVDQPLAGEDALAEQVLVGVRDRGRVGVDAGVARVEPREERAGGALEGDADARLQDAVALGDAALGGIEAGAVQRVDRDARSGCARRRAAGACRGRGVIR